jgi:hypothetical protein
MSQDPALDQARLAAEELPKLAEFLRTLPAGTAGPPAQSSGKLRSWRGR